jgi:hypothetical protein
MQPRDVMLAIAKKTGDIGASFYFDPETVARGKELGLDGFRFYFLGRGGVLGDVDSAVIRSAFGYFHPKVIARMWDTARTRMEPHYAAQAFIECCHQFGRRKFAGLEGLDAYVDAAGTVIAAVDGGAMALFAGVRAEPVPDDAPAAAIHRRWCCARCAAARIWQRSPRSGCRPTLRTPSSDPMTSSCSVGATTRRWSPTKPAASTSRPRS